MKRYSQAYRHICHLLFLSGLVWVAFSGSLKNDFVWDDYDLIINNKQIRDLSSAAGYFSRGFWDIEGESEDNTRDFFRPLVMASFAFDYRVYGLDPRGYHLTNLLAHMTCTLLVYVLALRFSGSPTAGLTATALWAVHPTHVENVVWISGRGDILAGLFFFLSCCMVTRWLGSLKESRWVIMVLFVCYAFALLCKEMAVTLPVLFLMAVFLLGKEIHPKKGWVAVFSMLFIVTLTYLAARKTILGSVVGGATGINIREWFLAVPMICTKYIGLLLGFFPVDPHHSEILRDAASPAFFALNMMTMLVYGAALFVAWRYRKRALLFCLLWFPVTLAPVLKFGGFGDILFADRFLYIPSVGLLFAAVFFVADFVNGKGKIFLWPAFVAACACLFMMVVYSRAVTKDWKDNLTLFSRAAKTSPDSAYIQFSLGRSLSDVEAYEKALNAYDKAISLHPDYEEAYNNKAFVLNRLGRYGEALQSLKKVMPQKGAHYSVLVNNGDAFMGFGDLETAEGFYRSSLATRKTAFGHHRLALCLMAQGKCDEARSEFTAALSIKRNPRVLNSLAELFLVQGDQENAIRYAKMALDRLRPGIPSHIKLEIHYNLARALQGKGNVKEAKDHVTQMVDLISSGYGAPRKRPEILEWLEDFGRHLSVRGNDLRE